LNQFTVAGATATNSADSGVITAVFPATAATIATAAIAGVTAPVTGATPTATITATAEYTATISWNPNPSTFLGGVVYTATITLTPTTGHTLTGIPLNFFTVSGATATNPINSGTITAVFPTTVSYATAPGSMILAGGATNPIAGTTNITVSAPGSTTTGAIRGWVTGTNDHVKLTVTDAGSATSTITINGSAYTSGADYIILDTTTLTIIVTTTEASKTTAVRTYTVTVTSDVAVGDNLQGGKVAYILAVGDTGYNPSVQHGLVAALTDQSTSKVWHATNDGVTGATGTAIGTGLGNTNAIIALYGAESNAAKVAQTYSVGIYTTGWYLPSKDELNKLYINKSLIGGFTAGYYWSSSEVDSVLAWSQNFNLGGQNSLNKNNSTYVRAVRAF